MSKLVHLKLDTVVHREMCYRCLKPKIACICDHISVVDNQTGIYIVQHARERRHPFGTVRIADLGLKNISISTLFPSKNGFCYNAEFPPDTALLYPSSHAVDIETLPEFNRPKHLVIIDGTWSQASQIYRNSPILRRLPCLKFGTTKPSNYRIRKEPNDWANSTIEAICRALTILEPDTLAVEELISSFDEMINNQIRQSHFKHNRRVIRPKKKTPKHIPQILHDKSRSLVIACGESGPIRHHPKKRELLTWNALRLKTGEYFKAILKPQNALTKQEIAHIKLEEQQLSNGMSPIAFRVRWQNFVRKDDVLITWNKMPLGRLFNLVGPHPHYLFLKAVYGNMHKKKCGHLNEVIERENLETQSLNHLPLPQRAKDRLQKINAVLTFLRNPNLQSSIPKF